MPLLATLLGRTVDQAGPVVITVVSRTDGLLVEADVVLRLNSPYRLVYMNLSADVTRRMTDKFCDAVSTLFV